jgi:hypothetical protein
VERARAVAVKSRQSAEMELGEIQAQLEEAHRLRADAEERAGAAGRERADIRTQLEENEAELAEVVSSHCIHVSYFKNGLNCKKNGVHLLTNYVINATNLIHTRFTFTYTLLSFKVSTCFGQVMPETCRDLEP